MRKFFILKPVYLFLFFISSIQLPAQIVTGNCFIQGQFVELGIGPCGTFGTTVDAPPGYHPRGGVSGNALKLGFVADAGKDGWNTGSPNYCGDYYVPGSPEEGWGLSINGVNYNNNQLCSISEITGAITQYRNDGTNITGIWEGNLNGLTIVSKTLVPIDKVYFLTEVSFKNTTTDTLRNIYYMRNIDPDNEFTLSGNYTTTNTIVDQNPNTENKAVVTALGLAYGCFVALGTRDCRAKVAFGGFSNRNPYEAWNCIFPHLCTGTQTEDEAITISFKLGDLLPGHRTSLKFVNVLNIADLDEAVDLTGPSFLIGDIDEVNSGDTAEICSSGPTVFEVVNTGGFDNWTWSPAVGLNTTSGPLVICDGSINEQVYTATGLNSCGGSISIHFMAKKGTITHVPKAGPISGSLSFCLPNTTASFSIAPVPRAKRYQWHVPPGSSILSGDGTTSITVNLGSTSLFDSIWVCGVNVCGSGDTSMVRVNVCDCNTIYPITPSNGLICPGDSVQLTTTAFPGGTYKWFKNGVLLPGLTGNSIFATDAGNYNAIIYPNALCTNNTTIATVTFSSPPTVSLSPAGTSHICENMGLMITATYTANAPGGVVLDWYKDGVLVAANGPASFNAVNDGVYYVMITNSIQCKTISNSITYINRQPTIFLNYTFEGDPSTCNGRSTRIKPVFESPDGAVISYQWYNNSVPIPGATDSVLAVNISGNYSVELTTVYGCSIITRDTALIFYPTPIAGFRSPSGCVEGKFTLTDTSTLAVGSIVEWVWKKDGILFSNEQNPSTDFTPGTYQLSLVVKSDKGCYSNVSSLEFLRYGKPTADFIVDGVCADSLTNLIVTNQVPGHGNTNIINWNWDLGNGLVSSAVDPSLIYDSAGYYNISLSFEGDNCSAIKNSISKRVYFGVPLPAKRYNNVVAVENEPFVLYGGLDGVDYKWVPTIGLNSPYSRITSGSLYQSQLYNIHVTNMYGCERIDTVQVHIINACKIYVPNIFSPNNDGTNENFRAYFGCLQSLDHFSIYNRFGQRLFYTKSSTEAWDGKVNGIPQEMGTYIWIAEGTFKSGKKFNEKGSFILMK